MINKDTSAASMSNLCRSCMGESTEMRNVFEATEPVQGQSLLIAEMLMACASIQVSIGDGFPDQLCPCCEQQLSVAYKFKKQCETTDSVLRKLGMKEETSSSSLDETIVRRDYLDEVIEGDDGDIGSESKPEAEAFACAYCPQVLATKRGLNLHQRRHTGEKMRNCNVCGAKFTRTNHLRRHVLVHETNAFRCSECGEGFQKAYHLAKHKKIHKIANVETIKVEADDDEDDVEDYFGDEDRTDLYGVNDDEDDDDDDDDDKNFARMGKLCKRRRGASKNVINKKATAAVMDCEFCDRRFKYRKSFVHHMQTEHGMSDESDDVPLSSYVDDGAAVKQEDPIDDSLKSKVAVACTDVESDKERGREPVPLSSKKVIHVCHVCTAKFDRANHLTRHMTLHRSVLIHKCARCDKAFATEQHLSEHTREDHIDKPYVCSLCDKPFGRGEHLIRHLKIHGDKADGIMLTCSICDLEFDRSDHLARHTKIHLQQDKRHVCSECGKAFNRLDNLKTHQRIHTGPGGNSSRLHLCIYCGKEFNNSSNMIVHMRRHTGERPYTCDQCGKGFPRSHDLKCHERTHSGEKPYLCTLCGKSFNKSNKLLRHTRVHTGERPYVCNLCGRAFTQSNDLALHMRRHTGSRPYACGVCPARFIQSGQLKLHRRSVGHWMDTQPDLKGGYRVEPVTPVTDPAPIRFKTHGKRPVLVAKKEQSEQHHHRRKEGQEEREKEEEEVEVEDETGRQQQRDEEQERRQQWGADEGSGHTVGIMREVVIGSETSAAGQPIIIESSKLLQHLEQGDLVGFAVIDSMGEDEYDNGDRDVGDDEHDPDVEQEETRFAVAVATTTTTTTTTSDTDTNTKV